MKRSAVSGEAVEQGLLDESEIDESVPSKF